MQRIVFRVLDLHQASQMAQHFIVGFRSARDRLFEERGLRQHQSTIASIYDSINEGMELGLLSSQQLGEELTPTEYSRAQRDFGRRRLERAIVLTALNSGERQRLLEILRAQNSSCEKYQQLVFLGRSTIAGEQHEEAIHALKEYAAAFGDLNVPREFVVGRKEGLREDMPLKPLPGVRDGFKLGAWVDNRRWEHNGNGASHSLNPNVQAQLEALPGWQWKSV